MMHLPQVEPSAIDLDEDRLQLAYQLLETWTDERSVPGGASATERDRGHPRIRSTKRPRHLPANPTPAARR